MDPLSAVHDWPVATVAAGWIDDHGGRATVGQADLGFALASVTKPLFAYAVLIAVEERTLTLDQPAGPEGSTVRHLLAHASGLGPDSNQPLSPPGSRRIYSNAGFEELGRLLEAESGMSPAEYLREAVVLPLGLTATSLEGSAAHGGISSVDDLLLVAAEWLRPTLVSTATMAAATTAQFPDLIGVLPGYGRQDPNPWGLGFEIRGTKQPHWTGRTNSPETYGHFGRSGTFLWVDPTAGTACAVLTDREFGSWSEPRWPALSDAVVAHIGGAA